MKFLAAAFIAACVVTAVPALAQQTPAPSPKPAASATPAASPSPSPSPTPRAWVTSGFADATYSIVGSSKSFQFANGGNSRVFDLYNKQPTLNNLDLVLAHNGTIGGKIEVAAGTDADVIASYPDNNTDGFDVTQAFLTYATGPFTLQVGKAVTLSGAEVIRSPDDVNLSRSILFGFAIPFTHTGARLTYAGIPNVTLIAGVNNGWDNLKGPGGPKTGEGAIAYTNKNLSLSTQSYSGTERISNAAWSNPAAFPAGFDSAGHRFLVDAVGSYKFGPVITGTLNYDHASQQHAPIVNFAGTQTGTGTAMWNGLAGYVSAGISKVTLTGRYEVFSDPQGYRTGFAQRWREGTLTFAYAPSQSLLFRLEGRADRSNQKVWVDGNGNPLARLSSFGFESIVRF